MLWQLDYYAITKLIIICDSTCEKGPLRGKIDFSLEGKISDIVNHAQNLFYSIIGIYIMSPTFRRAVRVQKHLIVPDRGDLTALLNSK